jgi:hypothetical protein
MQPYISGTSVIFGCLSILFQSTLVLHCKHFDEIHKKEYDVNGKHQLLKKPKNSITEQKTNGIYYSTYWTNNNTMFYQGTMKQIETNYCKAKV